MSKKVLQYAGRRRTLLAIIMATVTLSLLFSGWLTRLKADNGGSDPQVTVESISTNCMSEGSVTLDAPTNSPIACVGTSISVVAGIEVVPANVTIVTSNSDGSVIITTNFPNPDSGVTWTASVGDFSTNGTGLTATFTPTNCGSGTVSFTCNYTNNTPCHDIAASTTTGSFNAVQITLADNEIWWFNGENPDDYTMQTTATVCGAPSGATLVWSQTGPIAIDGSGESVTILNTGPSAQQNDATVKLTINGTQVCPVTLTVLAPDHQTPSAAPTDSPLVNGWESKIYYKIYDQFDQVLPYDVYWNEDIDGNGVQSTAAQVTAAAISDYSGQNWDWAVEGYTLYSSSFGAYDDIQRRLYGITPLCTNPQSPLGNTKVAHSPEGAWYCGSSTIGKGVKIANCMWQIYTDHGRHL